MSRKEWITTDISKTEIILSDIKKSSSFKYGPLPKKLLDFLIKENGHTLENWCTSMGMIARDIKHYLEKESPHEVQMVANNFSYLGGIPELPKEEIEEVTNLFRSMGINIDENGMMNLEDFKRVSDNKDDFERLMNKKKKDKNNEE